MPSTLDPWATATSYGVASGSGAFSSAVTESLAQLEKLWTDAGGPASFAPQAAAIAEAESGGNPTAYNATQATGDQSFGLWQINTAPNANPNYAGQVTAQDSSSIFNPAQNAADAVAVFTSQGPHAWTTYGSQAYQAALANAPLPTASAVVNASPAPAPSNPFQGLIQGVTQAPQNAANAVTAPIANAVQNAQTGIGAWFTTHPLGLLVAGLVLLVVAWALIGAPNISISPTAGA